MSSDKLSFTGRIPNSFFIYEPPPDVDDAFSSFTRVGLNQGDNNPGPLQSQPTRVLKQSLHVTAADFSGFN